MDNLMSEYIVNSQVMYMSPNPRECQHSSPPTCAEVPASRAGAVLHARTPGLKLQAITAPLIRWSGGRVVNTEHTKNGATSRRTIPRSPGLPGRLSHEESFTRVRWAELAIRLCSVLLILFAPLLASRHTTADCSIRQQLSVL